MNKLSLRLDEIRVISFEVVTPGMDGTGTVRGAEATIHTRCDGQLSCRNTCALTCDPNVCA